MASLAAEPRSPVLPVSARGLVAAARWSLLASLCAIALTLVLRRIGGALVLPLGIGGMIGVAAAGGLAAALVRWFGDGMRHTEPRTPSSALSTPYDGLIAGLIGFALPGLAVVAL